MEEGEWKDGKLVQEKPNYKTLDPDANGLNTGEDSDEFGSIDPIKTKKGPDPNNNSEIHQNNQIWDKWGIFPLENDKDKTDGKLIELFNCI